MTWLVLSAGHGLRRAQRMLSGRGTAQLYANPLRPCLLSAGAVVGTRVGRRAGALACAPDGRVPAPTAETSTGSHRRHPLPCSGRHVHCCHSLAHSVERRPPPYPP